MIELVYTTFSSKKAYCLVCSGALDREGDKKNDIKTGTHIKGKDRKPGQDIQERIAKPRE